MKLKARFDRRTAMETQRFLEAKQAEIKESMRSAVAQRCATEGSRPADPAVWASETLEDEIQIALIERQRRHLAQIEAALERLGQGAYGFCEDCAKFIGLSRLRALPFAKRCRDCQSRAERYARLKRETCGGIGASDEAGTLTSSGLRGNRGRQKSGIGWGGLARRLGLRDRASITESVKTT